MTDALRSGRALPAPRTPVPSVARPARSAVAGRVAAEARRPYHLGVLLGLSAGAYAVTLAAVATMQSATEQATQDANAPAIAAVTQLHAANETLDRRLATVRLGLTEAGSTYEGAAADLSDLGGRLDALATSVGVVAGQAAALPTRISLPSAPRISAGSRPATVATTGASGKPLP